MHRNPYISLFSLSVFACFLLTASISDATLILHVSLQTSPLIENPAPGREPIPPPPGPFYIDFQLNDGSGTGDQNNHVQIENFMGGTLVGPPKFRIGGATGSLGPGSSVSIIDGQFLNEFTQQFEPGSMLSFMVTLSTNPGEIPPTTPDVFAFSILDGALTPIGDGLGGSLLWVNIDSMDPAVNVRGAGDLLFAPRVIIPEGGSSLLMLLIGLAPVWCLRRRFVTSC